MRGKIQIWIYFGVVDALWFPKRVNALVFIPLITLLVRKTIFGDRLHGHMNLNR